MTRAELISKIEHLRIVLNGLAVARAGYTKMLKVSQVLDELIVEYYRTAV